MVKTALSYLIILSMLWADAVSAMKGTGIFSDVPENERENVSPRPSTNSSLLLKSKAAEGISPSSISFGVQKQEATYLKEKSHENKDPSFTARVISPREDLEQSRGSQSQDKVKNEHLPFLTPVLEKQLAIESDLKEEECASANLTESSDVICERSENSYEYAINAETPFLQKRQIGRNRKSDIQDKEAEGETQPLLNKAAYNNEDEDLTLREAAERIQSIEQKSFFLKWIYIDHLVEKMAYAFWLRKKNVIGVPATGWFNSYPLWIEGRGVPLKEGYEVARGITGFRQGVEFILERSLSLTLGGLIGYQIYQSGSFQPLKVLDIVWNGDEQSVRGALAVIVQNPANSYYFFSLFAAPLLWGVVKANLFARRDFNETPTSFERAVTIVQDSSSSSSKGRFRSLWEDKIRWLLPFHPLDREVNYLVYHLLLDGNLTLDQRKAGLRALIDLTKNTGGWSKWVGLDSLQKLTAGTSLKQLDLAGRAFGGEYKEALLEEKIKALAELRKQNPGIWKAGIKGLMHNLYANYLLWTLGNSESKTSALAWAIFKGGTLAIKAKFFIALADQIISYLKCPKPLQQGFNYAMQPAGYSLYNQKCFEAYLAAFNKVPGQPACTLVNLLSKFQLDPTYTLFNLSGAGATGEQVADLLTGLLRYQPSIHLTAFDLSYNAINTESGMRALFGAFKNITITSSPENGIKTLDLSENFIGYQEDTAALVLGQALHYLPHLQILDLSWNLIGRTADNGIIAIGESLHYLTNLQTLDLSWNSIGYIGENGPRVIGEGLKYLTNLQILDLSNNQISNIREIGEGLKYLSNLQTLDLSRNGIEGLIAIGESLHYLLHLQYLDLSQNFIGVRGEDSLNALGEGLKYLANLQTLDFSYNQIGNIGENGTFAIGEGLKYLTNLQSLNFSNNKIASGFSHLVHSIIQLETLESLFIQQEDGIIIPSSERLLLQQFWNLRNNNTDIYALITSQDVQDYLNSLSNNTKVVNLSKNFPYASYDLVTLLFKGMARFNDLQTLDLSNNQIGYKGHDGIVAIGESLHYFPHLQNLDLSENGIDGSGDNGLFALGKGLKHLTNLQTLNLSANLIGATGVDGPIALGESLKYLTNLQILDLSHNPIGLKVENGIIAIGESLQYLPYLQTLDLSESAIVDTGENGLIALGEGLKHLTNLQNLDLSENGIGSAGEKGLIVLGEGLRYLTNLQTLDLSWDAISLNENGIIAIADGLKYLTNLQSLDLSENGIGEFEVQNFFNAFPPLICHGLKTLNLQLNNFTDIPWNQAANALEGLYSSQIQQACQANRCFGTPIAVNTTAIQCRAVQSSSSPQDICPPLTSSASSLTLLFVFRPFAAFQESASSFLLPSPVLDDLPKRAEMVLYQKIPTPSFRDHPRDRVEWSYQMEGREFVPSSIDLFFSSAVKGATYAFGLEMARDVLEHGGVPRRTANIIVTATQAGIIAYTASSYLPTLTGMAINGGLAYMGTPSSVSSVIGTTAAIAATSMTAGILENPQNLVLAVAGGTVGTSVALKAKNSFSFWLRENETIAEAKSKIKSSWAYVCGIFTYEAG